ncbi:AraC family transcriptional regulator [Phyllobacterium brassicacearum]|uniref:AraC family transcriptional regulator n=1 Tax=Phyllobacterium brassicacearum TaxID=314235 RepID=A0A2P7BV20_9HYPH|nr:helix-turn-helix domain-containing protein [Phyllobacterium brassicacearum]PSH70313.1 AraC family transcriptional regulator [Phyllobacterium brassicacearum]TDQ28113.1 AraC family transcriptional regulator [Phyllobacterium brassicacearum]
MNAHDHIVPSDAPLDQNFAHAASASAVNCPPPQSKRSSAGSSSIPAFKFDTRRVPIDQQYDSWRKSFSSMLELSERRDRSCGFEGKQTVWDLGSLAFSRIRTSALEFASVPGHTRREALDHWTLTVPLDGTISTVGPASSFQGGAGVVQVHSLGRWFEGNVTDSEMLILFVPRDFDPEVAHVLGAAEFSAIDTAMGRLLSDYFIGLAKRLPAVEAEYLPELVGATQSMIRACLLPSPGNIEEAQAPIARVLLEKARRIVQSRLFDPSFNANVLRRDLAISRTGLYRMFEPFGGVIHYLQHQRLLDAHAALANPNDKRRIIEIAEQRCFSDGAEFSRAFKREFGYTPSEVRAGRKSGVPSMPTGELATAAPEERLGVLLRKLHG